MLLKVWLFYAGNLSTLVKSGFHLRQKHEFRGETNEKTRKSTETFNNISFKIPNTKPHLKNNFCIVFISLGEKVIYCQNITDYSCVDCENYLALR